jgi:DNA-binding NarL/FixJ family response regulator
MYSRPAIFLVDDHSDFCEAAMKTLRHTFDVVGCAHDARSAAAKVARVRPDLVVIDVCLRLIDAIDAAQQIREGAPSTRLLFVARDGDTSKPVSIGPLGFLARISDISELPEAIENVLSDRPAEEELQASQLTRREREVVQLLAEGKLMKQVADLLNVSPRTVAFHKYGVMRKLGLHSSAELVRMAVSEGLIGSATPGSPYESTPHSSVRSVSS